MTANVPQERHERQTVTDPVTADIARLRLLRLVNVYFVGQPGAGDGAWVLVDAGLPGTADQIARAAEEYFGPGSRPAAIVLTHGHFDHRGGLRELAERWDVPVYAHELELPYLTGRSDYPPPDPTVGGGMARISFIYPRRPIDLGPRARALPADGTVPDLPGWRAIHTPGHSRGHCALRFESALLVGEPMSIPESTLSVSIKPTPATRGGAVGKSQWTTSAIAVAARKPSRNARKPFGERRYSHTKKMPVRTKWPKK